MAIFKKWVYERLGRQTDTLTEDEFDYEKFKEKFGFDLNTKEGTIDFLNSVANNEFVLDKKYFFHRSVEIDFVEREYLKDSDIVLSVFKDVRNKKYIPYFLDDISSEEFVLDQDAFIELGYLVIDMDDTYSEVNKDRVFTDPDYIASNMNVYTKEDELLLYFVSEEALNTEVVIEKLKERNIPLFVCSRLSVENLSDKDILFNLATSDSEIFYCIPEEIREEKEFLLNVLPSRDIYSYNELLELLPEKLKGDKDFIKEIAFKYAVKSGGKIEEEYFEDEYANEIGWIDEFCLTLNVEDLIDLSPAIIDQIDRSTLTKLMDKLTEKLSVLNKDNLVEDLTLAKNALEVSNEELTKLKSENKRLKAENTKLKVKNSNNPQKVISSKSKTKSNAKKKKR